MVVVEEERSRSPKRKLSELSAPLRLHARSPGSCNTTSSHKNKQQQKPHLYSCAKEHVWQRYFSFPTTNADSCSTNSQREVSRPCPACSRPISLSQGANVEGNDKAFEVQHIIPWGAGADRPVDNWNLLPLCSRRPDFEDDGRHDEDQEEQEWGCSERLEREGDMHAFDWLRLNYPLRLQEVCMRLQLAHGESFSLPAGEALCLRFVRDVYSEGRCRIRAEGEEGSAESTVAGEVDPVTRHGEWTRRQCGFKSDILDLAECFSEMTDREMLRVIDMKTKLATPRVARRRLSATSTATVASTGSAGAVHAPRRSVDRGGMQNGKIERALFASTTSTVAKPRQPDSDDDSDYRSADSDDDSDTDSDDEGRQKQQELEPAPSLKRLKSSDNIIDTETKQHRENMSPNTNRVSA